MSTYTVMTDERRANDETTGEALVGNLQLGELDAASWGTSWQPDARARRHWLDDEEPPPPDEEPPPPDEELDTFSDEWAAWPNLEQPDAFGEDVRRLRRLLGGA
jgi:hypothetical protein